LSLPCALVLAFLLLVGAEARAQPSPLREPRQRSVTVTGAPADPPQEIHAAKGVATVLLFKSKINGAAVEVDRTRVKLLDAGEWSLTFEPLVEPGLEKPLLLSVPFADGKAAARAVFVLVSSHSEVDTRLDVVRLEPTVEACQEELAEAQARCSKSSPIRFARDGWLKDSGVIAHQFTDCRVNAEDARGLGCRGGTTYWARTWVLVKLLLVNDEPSLPPWVPREAALKSAKTGAPLKVRAVELEAARLPPGAQRWLFVEAEPPKAKETEFILKVRDAAGRGLTIEGVNLSAKEGE
jgi:uncharacterized protein (TIGR02268 family)